MDIKEIMEINVNNLKAKQHEALKQHIIDRLQTVIALVQSEQFEYLDDMLEASESGDGWGQDNHYIDFGYDKRAMDIKDVIEKLEGLK